MNLMRIQEIKNSTVPFPLFLTSEPPKDSYERLYEQSSNVTSAIYVEDIFGNTPLGMPETVTIIRETADGVITSAVYEVAESYKSVSGSNLSTNIKDN